MFEKFCNLKNRKKGFTLVELIVVMVILAILLAILVPSMTQWITKAKNRQVMVNARTVYLAAQSVASEKYGTDTGFTGNTYAGTVKADGTTACTGMSKDIVDLAALNKVGYTYTCTISDAGVVTKFTYYEGEDTANAIIMNEGDTALKAGSLSAATPAATAKAA